MTESSNFILRAEDISKSFVAASGEQFSVLDKLSFVVPRGAIVGILGASGCGKTTLLNILAGLLQPGSGKIDSPLRRPGKEIGFIQQSERLLPWRDAAGNVALGLELLGASKSKARQSAGTMLATMGMREFETHYPPQLSGGMTQRVLLARTFAAKPSLLLLDEPLGQLDIVGRKTLANNVREYVRANNAAAIIVTHSVEEAVFISDIILTLTRRPSCIAGRFTLRPEFAQHDFVHAGPDACFDVVLQSLLRAIGTERAAGEVL